MPHDSSGASAAVHVALPIDFRHAPTLASSGEPYHYAFTCELGVVSVSGVMFLNGQTVGVRGVARVAGLVEAVIDILINDDAVRFTIAIQVGLVTYTITFHQTIDVNGLKSLAVTQTASGSDVKHEAVLAIY